MADVESFGRARIRDAARSHRDRECRLVVHCIVRRVLAHRRDRALAAAHARGCARGIGAAEPAADVARALAPLDATTAPKSRRWFTTFSRLAGMSKTLVCPVCAKPL